MPSTYRQRNIPICRSIQYTCKQLSAHICVYLAVSTRSRIFISAHHTHTQIYLPKMFRIKPSHPGQCIRDDGPRGLRDSLVEHLCCPHPWRATTMSARSSSRPTDCAGDSCRACTPGASRTKLKLTGASGDVALLPHASLRTSMGCDYNSQD